MLPSKNRLKNKKDFEILHQNGDFFSVGSLFLKSLKNGEKETKIGFSVGLKFSKKAIERNQLRRRLRNLVAKEIERIKEGRNILIGVQKSASGKTNSERLKDNLEILFEKANLIIK